MDKNQLQDQLYSLLVPSEILLSFDIVSVIEKKEEILINLLEKEELIPLVLAGKASVLNGFMNVLEIQSSPIQCKTCYLKLKRRRWKQRGTSDSTNCHNEYDYTSPGTKATKLFGAFLKENGWETSI